MMISLGGGAPGPDQGRNPIAAKPIQEVAPGPARPKNDAPPALAKPEMVEPMKTAPTPPEGGREARAAEGNAAAARPHADAGRGGDEGDGPRRDRQHDADSVRRPGDGGGGTGGLHRLRGFLLPRIPRPRWSRLSGGTGSRSRDRIGANTLKFTIRRDGTIVDVEIETGRRTSCSNLASQRALITTAQLPPLPAAFTPTQLTVHLVFRIPAMTMKRTLLCVARARRRRVARGRTASSSRRHAAAAAAADRGTRAVISAALGRAAEARDRRLHSAVGRRRDGRRGEDDQRGALRRHRLRARVLHDREGRGRDRAEADVDRSACRSSAGRS